MTRQLEPWGGEVRLPRFLRWLLRRPPVPDDTPERAHEQRKGEQPTKSVVENTEQAAIGPLGQFYREGRRRGRPR
jgi:hypothetical protein